MKSHFKKRKESPETIVVTGFSAQISKSVHNVV